MELAKGFSGNADGFKEETFKRHAKYHVSEKHKKCQDACDKMGLAPIVNTSIFRKPHNGKANLEKDELCAIFSCRQLGVYGGHGR